MPGPHVVTGRHDRRAEPLGGGDAVVAIRHGERDVPVRLPVVDLALLEVERPAEVRAELARIGAGQVDRYG